MNKKIPVKIKNDTKNLFTKQWVELTLCDLADDVIGQVNLGGNQKNIMKIIHNYANQIFITQKESSKNKKI